jgi:hypothetical protein
LVMVSEAREGDFLAIFPKTGNSTHTLWVEFTFSQIHNVIIIFLFISAHSAISE